MVAAAVHHESPHTVRYWPRGAAAALFREHGPECVVAGPAGCVAGETRIFDPTTGDAIPIVDLYRECIAPTVLTLLGPIRATAPFRKGVAKLYRVRLASGRECVVTGDHRLLRSDGWAFVRDLHAGDAVLASFPNLPASNSAASLPTSPRDDGHLIRTLRGSTDRCADDCHPCDARSLSALSSDQAHAPSQGDARGHSRVDQRGDGRLPLSVRTHPGRSPVRLAMPDCSGQPAGMVRIGSDGARGTRLLGDGLSRLVAPSRRATILLPRVGEGARGFPNTRSHGPPLASVRAASRSRAPVEAADQGPWPLPQPIAFAHTTQEWPPVALGLDACSPSFDTSMCNYTAQWDTVSTIAYERTDEYYDLHVPGAEHYLADGIWHHNTGKTYAALWRLHLAALKYPGMRGIIVRKTLESLTASALVTYQTRILAAGAWGVQTFGGSKLRPAGFRYPNGAELLVGGLDKAEKVMSQEYDLVFVNEATDLDEGDWEALTTRTRWGRMPYQQVYGDCNPQGPGHWLYQRSIAGRLVLLTSVHEDNPDLYDGHDWTERGRAYLAQLDALTGHRRERLRYGRWVAAEGVVYPAFNRAQHVQSVDCADWAAAIGVDVGTRNPTAILTMRYAGDRLHIGHEVYQTELSGTQIVDAAIAAYRAADATFAVIDPSAAGLIKDLTAAGISARRANNDVLTGIKRVEAALPTLTVDPSCVNTIREFEAYRYPPKGTRDHPLKEDDHTQDACRYLVLALTSTPPAVAASGVTQRSRWR